MKEQHKSHIKMFNLDQNLFLIFHQKQHLDQQVHLDVCIFKHFHFSNNSFSIQLKGHKLFLVVMVQMDLVMMLFEVMEQHIYQLLQEGIGSLFYQTYIRIVSIEDILFEFLYLFHVHHHDFNNFQLGFWVVTRNLLIQK